MEDLAEHTSSVTNELLAQLAAKIERTTKSLVGDIEVLVTSALDQLSQPIENVQKEIETANCQPLTSLEQLNQRLNSELQMCTLDLNTILNTFQHDAQEYNIALEQYIRAIIDLPKKCEGLDSGSGFGSKVSCYVESIADLNKQIALILNQASVTLVHTRQLAEQAMQEGRMCADDVITTTTEALDEILASCQLSA